MLSRENVGETSSPFEFGGSVDLKEKKKKKKGILVNMMIMMMMMLIVMITKVKTKHTKITGLNFIPPVLFPFSPSPPPLPPRKVFTTSPG